MTWTSKGRGLLVVFLGVVTGFVVATLRSTDDLGVPDRPVGNRLQTGTELVGVFIGASTCDASNHPELAEALRLVRAEVGRRTAYGKVAGWIGVSVDSDLRAGLRFLEGFSQFDEVMAGGGWLNAGANTYLVGDFPGQRAIPQLLLLERDLEVEEGRVVSVQERLVARRVGADAILAFARSLLTDSQ